MKTSVQSAKPRQRQQLAVYLGASNSRRFPQPGAGSRHAEGIRVKLLVAAVVMLCLCLWGLWHEFF
ncbi:MAG: hypothetical protein GX595_16520 [Lentisphaerae bacterium]|nr:hypothetical protein [Lentisphaerota bacterium]